MVCAARESGRAIRRVSAIKLGVRGFCVPSGQNVFFAQMATLQRERVIYPKFPIVVILLPPLLPLPILAPTPHLQASQAPRPPPPRKA